MPLSYTYGLTSAPILAWLYNLYPMPFRWLRRRLPVARLITFIFITILAPSVALYFWITISFSVSSKRA